MKRKRCYYEVLHIRLTSTLSQIRHPYHQLAMKYHPDKNKTESAKEHFQEINEAYSILSNPSEKLFYDRHRDTIVRNWNLDVDVRNKEAENKETAMLPSEAGMWPFFARPAYLGFDDSEHGFYTVYRNIFKAIQYDVEQMNDFVEESEESSLVDPSTQYLIVRAPSFGDSETKLSEVAQFYVYWENLPNILEEAWKDLTYSGITNIEEMMFEEDEDDRRLLQQRFIDIIRNLVGYVKRIDPRYLEYQKNKELLNDGSLDLDVVSYTGRELMDKLANLELTSIQKAETIIAGHHHGENCLECWNWAMLNLKRILDFGWGAMIKQPQMEISAMENPVLPLPMCEPKIEMEVEEENRDLDSNNQNGNGEGNRSEEVGISDA